MKKGHRLRAPSTDGGLLAVPPLAEVAAHFTRDRGKARRLGSRLPGPPGRHSARPRAS